jgi:hypothetical protein
MLLGKMEKMVGYGGILICFVGGGEEHDDEEEEEEEGLIDTSRKGEEVDKEWRVSDKSF